MNKSHHDTAMPDWYAQLVKDAKNCPANSEKIQMGGYRFGARSRKFRQAPPESDFIEMKERGPSDNARRRAAIRRTRAA